MVEWSELLAGIVGSLIGGGLAILGTVLGIHLQHQAQDRLEEKAAAAEVTGYLGALHAELTVLSNSFRTRVQPALEAVPEGQIFDFRWPARFDYFTVYNSNAQMLGRIPDPELRTLIVTTYTATKGMLDALGYNGEAVEALANLDPARKAQIGRSTDVLAEHARDLKRSTVELEGLIAAVLPRLKAAR